MDQGSVVVIGENLVDLLVSPNGDVAAVIGGGPLNVARTIARLGREVTFVSGISDDAFGRQILASLHSSGVHVALPQPAPEPTTLAVVELNESGPRYRFHLRETASFQLPSTYVLATNDARRRTVYVGTLGLVVEPMAARAEALVRGAHRDVLVVVDPNCRPSAITDEAAFRDRLTRLYRRSDVVKVSTEDLDYLSPHRSHLEGARDILAAGAQLVVLTDGPRPVTVVAPNFTFGVDVPPTDVVDTVGAGDALVGGFITWWAGHGLSRTDLTRAADVRRAIGAAIDISRRTCERAGAEPPSADEVRQLPPWHWL